MKEEVTLTDTISLSIKKCYIDLHKDLVKLKPNFMSLSTFVFNILQEYIDRRKGNQINFFESVSIWNDFLDKADGTTYKMFYDQLKRLNTLEQVKTRQRIQ